MASTTKSALLPTIPVSRPGPQALTFWGPASSLTWTSNGLKHNNTLFISVTEPRKPSQMWKLWSLENRRVPCLDLYSSGFHLVKEHVLNNVCSLTHSKYKNTSTKLEESPAWDAMSSPGDGDDVLSCRDGVIITFKHSIFHLQHLHWLLHTLWRSNQISAWTVSNKDALQERINSFDQTT